MQEFECRVGNYEVNNVLLIRFPALVTEYLSMGTGYAIDPASEDYRRWTVYPDRRARSVLHSVGKDKKAFTLTRGTGTLQPALGYWGLSPARAMPRLDSKGIDIEVTERVPPGQQAIGRHRKLVLPRRPYRFIEPIEPVEPPPSPPKQDTSHAFIQQTLDAINKIEAETGYRLIYDASRGRWTFARTIG